MANYKPQSPLIMNGEGIFPLTTYDQIIMPDGSRWNGSSAGNSVGGGNSTNSGVTVTLNGNSVSNASFYAPTSAGSNGQVLKSNGSGAPTWATETTYSAGTGLSLSGTTFGLNVAAAKTALGLGSNAYTSTAYLPLEGGTMTGALTVKGMLSISANDGTHEGGEILLLPANSSFKTGHIDLWDNQIRFHNGSATHFSVDLSTGEATATKIYGAVWNDYAEYRAAETIEPGRVVREDKDGVMKITTERLMPACEITSDTFGFAIGETDDCKTPIAVAGRVLVYTDEDRYNFQLGDAVCSGPNGTVSRMTREEIREYPERIIGTVSEIPEYETWGTGNVAVNGRIWVKVK